MLDIVCPLALITAATPMGKWRIDVSTQSAVREYDLETLMNPPSGNPQAATSGSGTK